MHKTNKKNRIKDSRNCPQRQQDLSLEKMSFPGTDQIKIIFPDDRKDPGEPLLPGVGDWIKTGNVEGIAEQIGFRSVRIRAFDGRLLDVPNRLIADAMLENFSNREYWREHFTFSLTYQTTAEELEKALHILEEIGNDVEELLYKGKK